jgi:hypothetical protein
LFLDAEALIVVGQHAREARGCADERSRHRDVLKIAWISQLALLFE